MACWAGGASGGGGLVHWVLFGAMCSGGVRDGTQLSPECRFPDSKNSGWGERHSVGAPLGLMELLPTVYGVWGGRERRGGTKTDGGDVVVFGSSLFSSHIWASATMARGRIARILDARMNSPRIYSHID